MYLNCKTFLSYRYGTLDTQELVTAAAAAGVTCMALTNINNTSDIWDFMGFCHESGIRPIAGVEVRNGDQFCYLLLARNNLGLQHINRFLSVHLQQKQPFATRPLIDSETVWVVYPLGQHDPATLHPHELIGVKPVQVNKLYTLYQAQYAHKYVVQQPVTYLHKAGYNTHRLLRAIDKNILLSQQQASEIAGPDELLEPEAKLLQCFESYPQIVHNTYTVMASCEIALDFKADKNRKLFTHSAEEDWRMLERLSLEGLAYRYPESHKDHIEAKARLYKELSIISKQGFITYFLITWDIIRYARHKDFFYVGRGSGANSMVAYCLKITDVNPLELDLYFERFLNPNRSSPPDFDMDFSWKDRDEIIRYVFDTYGSDHVSLLGMYSTFQKNATIRELGKVFGLPKHEIDALLRKPELPDAKDAEDKIHRIILQYSKALTNFPNHLSIHAGGMLISELPIHHYTVTELPPKGFATSQLDMHVAEKIGLNKFDILSQRGLGHIKDAIQLVQENKQVSIDIHEVEKFKKDPVLAQKIKQADSIGCFYIESPAMRQLLQKLRCEDYLTLVAASSIIRPGVAQSGMMRQYILRFHDPKQVVYLHPKMEELLKETFGVMVYQEDVIKVAHHFAGLDMAEADILRRAMSGKYRGHDVFLQIRQKFFNNCDAFGYDKNVTAEVWRQIESFGGYSFSKAHSASFAVESYQSLYLKTYFPMEFMVAVINNFGGFYNTELYFHELKRTGAQIHAPCVNQSKQLTQLYDKEVYLGFVHIQNLEEQLIYRILEERHRHGSFLHLQDFIERVQPPLEQLNILIRCGALRFTGKNKKALLWEANFLQKKNKQHVPAHSSIFEEKPMDFVLPELHQHPLDDALDEMEILGFPLGDVFRLLDDPEPVKYTKTIDLPQLQGTQVDMMGYLVTSKYARTLKGEHMFFGTFLDADGNWLDTVHFPDSAHAYLLQGRGFYRLQGIVNEEFGVYTVNVTHMQKMGLKGRRS